MENNELKIKQQIMEEIEQDHIKMRPKAYFIAGALLLGFGFVLAVVLGVLSVSIANFHLRNHGPFGYLFFGEDGISPFVKTFPFIPIVIAILSIGLGIYFIRKYEVSYKHSFWGIVVTLIFSTAGAGLLLDHVGMNEKLAGMKSVDSLYENDHFIGDEWVIGEVIQVSSGEKVLLIKTPRQDTVKVYWTDSTKLPWGNSFDAGMRVRVIGIWDGDVFNAYGIGSGEGMRWRPLPTLPESKVKGYRYMINYPHYPLIAE